MNDVIADFRKFSVARMHRHVFVLLRQVVTLLHLIYDLEQELSPSGRHSTSLEKISQLGSMARRTAMDYYAEHDLVDYGVSEN